MHGCPFCAPDPTRVVCETPEAVALLDGYPLSPGHTLVVPRLHVASLFDAPPSVLAAVWALVGEVRARLAATTSPDGFNIGLNDGAAAGQTVMHAHVHVIPRWRGDVSDPRGGVRHVLPAKARYWEPG